MPRFCSQCGAQNRDDARFCTRCATPFTGAFGHQSAAPPSAQSNAEPPPYQPGMNVQAAYQPTTYQPAYPPPQGAQQGLAPGTVAKSKMAAGLLGIFLGAFGIHRLYLGYNAIGIIQLVLGLPLGLLTCGVTTFITMMWGLIEGIMILTGSINTDAQGMPLKD